MTRTRGARAQVATLADPGMDRIADARMRMGTVSARGDGRASGTEGASRARGASRAGRDDRDDDGDGRDGNAHARATTTTRTTTSSLMAYGCGALCPLEHAITRACRSA
eukprot:12414004-Karenia_brevis.AAC.1